MLSPRSTAILGFKYVGPVIVVILNNNPSELRVVEENVSHLMVIWHMLSKFVLDYLCSSMFWSKA